MRVSEWKTVCGLLMSKDTVLAVIHDGALTEILNETLLPLHFRLAKDASLCAWLSERAIDTRRTNSRLLRKKLGLSDLEPADLALSVNAAVITDTYWVKPQGSELTWEDVRYRTDELARLALLGAYSGGGSMSARTPELTNVGSFEKCWRLEDGIWWLYKKADADNSYFEVVTERLGTLFGFDMAYYETVSNECAEALFQSRIKPGTGIVRSKDFTGGAVCNLETAQSLGIRQGKTAEAYEVLYKLSPKCARQFLQLLTMDALVYNLDRHTKNFGILRNPDTGAILGLAPNYDNNCSIGFGLLDRQHSTGTDETITDWRTAVEHAMLPVYLPPVCEEELRAVFASVDMEGITAELREEGVQFVWARYQVLAEHASRMNLFCRRQVTADASIIHLAAKERCRAARIAAETGALVQFEGDVIVCHMQSGTKK